MLCNKNSSLLHSFVTRDDYRPKFDVNGFGRFVRLRFKIQFAYKMIYHLIIEYKGHLNN